MVDKGWQVSWLTDHSRTACLPNARTRQWLIGGGLTAHSCGGSRGIAPRSLFILLPLDTVGGTIQLGLYAPPHPPSKATHLPDLTPGFTLVLGGARSGKSRYAESLFSTPGPRTYIATAQAFDDEMHDRIAAHRTDRAAAGWTTIEEPLDLPGALRRADAPVLVDCLTLWVSNLLLADRPVPALEAALATRTHRTVLVSNEVGLGIVPDNVLARRFRDEAGRLHQRLAAIATTVTLVVAGIPMRVK